MRPQLGEDAKAALAAGTLRELAAAGRLACIFHVVGRGGSGGSRFMRRSQFKRGLNELRVRASPPTIDEIFRELDNGTGKIGFLALNRWLAGAEVGGGGASAPSGGNADGTASDSTCAASSAAAAARPGSPSQGEVLTTVRGEVLDLEEEAEWSDVTDEELDSDDEAIKGSDEDDDDVEDDGFVGRKRSLSLEARSERAWVLDTRLRELLIETNDLPTTLGDTASAPRAAPDGPPPIENAEGRWDSMRLGCAISRLLDREGVSPEAVFKLWDTEGDSARAGGLPCLARSTWLAGMQAMLNDDKLWMVRVRKIAGNLFDKLQVAKVLRQQDGTLERVALIRHSDFRAWMRQQVAAAAHAA